MAVAADYFLLIALELIDLQMILVMVLYKMISSIDFPLIDEKESSTFSLFML